MMEWEKDVKDPHEFLDALKEEGRKYLSEGEQTPMIWNLGSHIIIAL